MADQIDVARIDASSNEIAELLRPARTIGACAVEVPRQPDNRITRHQGIWGNSPLGRNPKRAKTWQLASGRQVGVAILDEAEIAPMVEFVAGRTAFLFLAGPCDLDLAGGANSETLLDEASERLEWGKILTESQLQGWTPVRVVRDEFGLEAQVFGTPNRLARMGLTEASSPGLGN